MSEYIEYTLDGEEFIDIMAGTICHTMRLESFMPTAPYARYYEPPQIRRHNFPLF